MIHSSKHNRSNIFEFEFLMEENKGLEKKLDNLCDVKLGKETWCLKVRVFRSWSVSTFSNSKETNSIEMILVNEKVLNVTLIMFLFLLYMFDFSIIKK